MEVTDSLTQTIEEQYERAAVNQVTKPCARIKFRNRPRMMAKGQPKYKGTAASATETTCNYCGWEGGCIRIRRVAM